MRLLLTKIHILLKAFQHKLLSNIQLNIIGKGLQDLKNINNFSSENIIFHDEIIDEKEISKIANQCRLFIYPGIFHLLE